MGFKPLTYKNAPGEEPHITPEDDAAIYESIVGTDGVFTVGEQFKATVISNNKVRIGNGVLNVGGHMGRTTYGDYVDVTIENGVSEQNRNDLIIARFVIGDTDTYELDVKKGVSGKEAVDPELVQEDLYNGGKTREYPLYRVKIEGLSIVKVEQIFEIRPTIPMLNKYLSELSDKLKTEHFLTKSNHTEYLTIGNLRGGKIENISGNKCGNVVTLYVQIGGITQGGADVSIFQFKEKYRRKYGPSNYAVHNAYISKQNNIVYIGQFNDAHFSMAIAGNGEISASNPAQIIFTITYLTD